MKNYSPDDLLKKIKLNSLLELKPNKFFINFDSEKAESITKEGKELINKITNNLKQKQKMGSNKFSEEFAKATESVKEEAKTIASDVKSGVEKAAESVKEEVASIASKITGIFHKDVPAASTPEATSDTEVKKD